MSNLLGRRIKSQIALLAMEDGLFACSHTRSFAMLFSVVKALIDGSHAVDSSIVAS